MRQPYSRSLAFLFSATLSLCALPSQAQTRSVIGPLQQGRLHWMTMRALLGHRLSIPSCRPSRYGGSAASSLRLAARSLHYQNELARAEAFYDKRRVRQRYLDEQRQRRMYSQCDVNALREHRQAVLEIAELKRLMRQDRNRGYRPAPESQAAGSQKLRLVSTNSHAAGLPAAPPRSGSRTWLSADGRHRVEAALVSCEEHFVTLRREADGQLVRVAFGSLHPTDRDYLRTRTGWGRRWKDASGTHAMVAQLVEFRDGVVTLARADGSKVRVLVDQLSSADQDFLAERESARQTTPRDWFRASRRLVTTR